MHAGLIALLLFITILFYYLLVLFDEFLEAGWTGPHETVDDFSTLDEEKCRHGTHLVLGGGIWIFVYVDFDKHHGIPQ